MTDRADKVSADLTGTQPRGQDLASRTALVLGAGRGLGRGVALALEAAGAQVIAVARSAEQLSSLAAQAPGLRTEVADAADARTAATLLDRYRPDLLVMVAGAEPVLQPLHRLTWEQFSRNWQADVKIAFTWIGEVLRLPLGPGATVILFSSGAALQGSPLSGGYAGAKATQRFIARYAQDESERAGLDLRFVTVLPRLTPATALGRPAVEAYAAREGLALDDYLSRLGTPVTPESAGEAVIRLAADPALSAPEYLLTGDGLRPSG